MAQLNQLLTSGSDVATPPSDYLAMFFAPGNILGFKDSNGDLIFPTASLKAVTASFAERAEVLTSGDKLIQGSLTVTGQLIAEEYIISSSVTHITELNASGSTRFGDSIDDTHQITGSLSVTGSASITGPLNATSITSSFQGNVIGNIVGNITGSISGSDAKFSTITGSILGSDAKFTSITGSISGSDAKFSTITGSLQGSVVGNITGSISGSDAKFSTITGSLLGTASNAELANRSNSIQVNSFNSDIESYLLVSNVIASSGVGVGGDSELRYNTLQNKLTVPSIVSNITGSISGSDATFSTISGSNVRIASTASIGTVNVDGDLITRYNSSNILIGNRGNQYSLILGNSALPVLAAGFSFNTALGNSSLTSLGRGSSNTAVGNQSGTSLISGSGNTFLGQYAGGGFYTGSNNIFIGYVNSSFTTGSNNTLIGSNLTSLPNTLFNNIVLSDGEGNIRAQYSGSWNLATGVTSPSFSGSFTGSIAGSISGSSAQFTSITGSISGSTARFTSTTSSLLGNVVGNITGSISGSSAQFTSITGSLLGNIIGNVTGSISGSTARFTSITGSLLGTAATASYLNNLSQSVEINNNIGATAALNLFGTSTFTAINGFDFLRVQNQFAGVPTPWKFFRIDNSGSLNIINSGYNNVIFNLTDLGSLSLANDITASNLWVNSNGGGKNILVGDDAYFGDVNIPNLVQLSGQQDQSKAYLKFANGSNTPVLWTTGSNILQLDGSLVVSGSIIGSLQGTSSNASTASLAINAISSSYALTASTLIGNSTINGNVSALTFTSTANGLGSNLSIGDDIWMGDVNLNNTLQVMGKQNNDAGYIKFGNPSTNPIIGASGNLLTVNTSMTIGSSLTNSSLENTLNIYPAPAGGSGEGGQILLAASGGLYTSASMLDVWQNKFRLLKGTNTGGSTGESFNIDLQNHAATFNGLVTSIVGFNGPLTGTVNGATVDNTAWTSYTPTFEAQNGTPAIGNGSITGAYKVIGKTCFVRVKFTAGSTTTYGSNALLFGLPLNAANADSVIFPATILDSGNAWYQATVNGQFNGTNNKVALIGQSGGGANSSQGVTGTFPIGFGSNDSISFNGSYEIA